MTDPTQDAVLAAARSRATAVQGLLTDANGALDDARRVIDRLITKLDRETGDAGPVPATGWSIGDDGAVELTASTGVVVRVHPDDVAEIVEASLGARDLIPVEITKADSVPLRHAAASARIRADIATRQVTP